MDLFAPYMDGITALCKAHKVGSLHAFGSTVKGSMDADSDVDLLLVLPLEDPFEFADHYWALEEGLEDLFKRKVDLVSRRMLRNRYFIEGVDAHKVKLYEA